MAATPDVEHSPSADPSAAPGGSAPRIPSKDRWDKFEIVARALLALGSLVIAAAIPLLLSRFEQSSREAQARREIEQIELQRMDSKARLVSSLLPQLVAGDAAARQIALMIVASVDPGLATAVETVLSAPAGGEPRSDTAREVVGAIASRTERLLEIQKHIDRGDAYLRHDLSPEATRELLEAARLIPEDLRPQVDWLLVEEARGDYEKDRYGVAARKLRRALSPLAGTT